MTKPLLQGVRKHIIHIILLRVLNLLGLSQQKNIESMKSYSTHPMEIDYAPSSTLVGI